MALKKSDNYLVISDLQIPFEHPDALDFCKRVSREFSVSKENVLNVGDEVDHYFGSLYPKSVEATHTALSELAETKKRLKAWYKAFPYMRIAISNHGMRWAKKAFDAQIPAQMIRTYQEVIEAPEGWKWKQRWVIKNKFQMIHGMGYSGQNGHRNAAVDAGMNTIIGHLHSHAGISHVKTSALDIWGMNVGCLIDVDAYAFQYGKDMRHKPTLGVGVVVDGTAPLWVPYGVL